jgi:hypothetical protein
MQLLEPTRATAPPPGTGTGDGDGGDDGDDGGGTEGAGRAERAPSRIGRGEILLAAAAFGALCLAVLSHATQLLEPDDYAYRASIIALAHGHLTLSNGQYQSLLRQLSAHGGGGIQQWHRLADGRWVSEKNPGYPFFAVPFYAIGLLRVAPLFFGALGSVGLFCGGRRWLGRWGGGLAVALFCSSGVAMVFAWRDTMPTFTETSLLAAGTGALLWSVLAVEATPRRRSAVGLLAFVCLEGAVFVRYTDIVVLGCALVAVTASHQARSVALPRRALAWWLGSAALAGAGILAFNALVYGKALSTGYSPGEITFGLGAVPANLEHMPYHLTVAMPVFWLALVAAGWIAVRARSARRARRDRRDPARQAALAEANRDLAVGAALAASWFGIWGLYAMYYWTAQMSDGTGATVHVVRFFVPALAAIALLGAWALVRMPRWLAAGGVVLLFAAGLWSFGVMRSTLGPGGGPGGGSPGIGSPLGGAGPGGGHGQPPSGPGAGFPPPGAG